MPNSSLSDAIDSGLRASPPLTVTAASFMGLPLESWVYLVTLIYTIIQIAFTIWKWRGEYNKHLINKEGTYNVEQCKSDNRK